jgi:pilus assembly protein Flp/PilA
MAMDVCMLQRVFSRAPSGARRSQMFLIKAIEKTRRFLRRKEGASGIEYAIVAAMVAVVLVAFITPISGSVNTIFTGIRDSLKTATTSTGTGGSGGTTP